MGMHRSIASGLLAATAAALLLPAGCRLAQDSRPDVLLITVDTLRADHLGSYGFPFETSPRIDALAREGVLFERAIAAASRTVPAHASIMTSSYTREHSVGHLNGKSTLRGATSLAERFRDGGYATAAFIGNILLTRGTGLGAGFELFDDDIGTPELNRPHVVERLADQTTARAVAWLEEPREQPVFLWVHYQDPHGPYTPPADAARFRIPPREGETPLPVGDSNQGRRGVPPYQVLPGVELPSEYVSRYAGEIFFADREIAALLEAFDARPRQGVVLLTADHGESLGENERWFMHTHATTPDVAHVPFILRAPGLPSGRRRELVSHVDVLPTLLDLAGLPVPEDVRGVALGPVIRGEAEVGPRWVYCDIGSQLSVYNDEGFVQILGLEGAWRGDGLDLAHSPRPYRRFAWSPGEPWTLIEQGRAPLPAALADYADRAVPMVELPPPDPEQLEQLRALGYLDP